MNLVSKQKTNRKARPMAIRERVEKILINQDEKCNLISTTGDYMAVVDIILHAIAEDVEGRKKSCRCETEHQNYIGSYNRAITDIVKMLREGENERV